MMEGFQKSVLCTVVLFLFGSTLLAYSLPFQAPKLVIKARKKSKFRMATESTEATWCPEKQIYIGGVVPDNAEVEELLKSNDGTLHIFGYGSLCWSPGTGALAKGGVTTSLGRAVGYKRCWSQKSADHRGTPDFPGIVCTLLKDEEVRAVRDLRGRGEASRSTKFKPSMTEGVIYTVPPQQVQDCLAELDFREKGGYARDVITVIEQESGRSIQALLYRGTLDNPMFWKRALLDLPFAAAVMAVSVGPSGKNDAYLFNLDKFMSDSLQQPDKVAADSPIANEETILQDNEGDSDTHALSQMARTLQETDVYFMYGCGSNQHNQLLLFSKENNACLVNQEDAHELTLIVLTTEKSLENGALERPRQLVAGGGHSGILMESGILYLWGWNESGQLGMNPVESTVSQVDDDDLRLLMRKPITLSDGSKPGRFEQVALGFSHTLAIEKDTLSLYAFGDNGRGQVLSNVENESSQESETRVFRPTRPPPFVEDQFRCVSAGLFHSAAITTKGELITFGCKRFGQCFNHEEQRWRPSDGSQLVYVACGRRHTVVLDEHGRIWTMGENKYGQLGRPIQEAGARFENVPRLVEGTLGLKGSGCISIDSGWSHTVATIQRVDEQGKMKKYLWGWGRNDKGQLGAGSTEGSDDILVPRQIFGTVTDIELASCGSESTVVVRGDGALYGSGWNEHGNLATGNDEDVKKPTRLTGSRIRWGPSKATKIAVRTLLGVGGAHLLAMSL